APPARAPATVVDAGDRAVGRRSRGARRGDVRRRRRLPRQAAPAQRGDGGRGATAFGPAPGVTAGVALPPVARSFLSIAVCSSFGEHCSASSISAFASAGLPVA